jgi:hypothetical protein
MKNLIQLLSILLLLICTNAFAWDPNEKLTGKKGNSTITVAAGCSPATTKSDLSLNNVRITIGTGGDMWFDGTIGGAYEVPKGSGKKCMYSGSLWLGGKDVSGQLKVAGIIYRSSGDDFWPGPLNSETAEIDPETCIRFDKHYYTKKSDIELFSSWYECNINPDCDASFEYPGYTIPSIITDWPAHGRNYDPYFEDFNLAPFYDRNKDGNYNPEDGDHPGYELNPIADCSGRKSNIYGDENLWWVTNDKGNVHTATGSASIGMEIRTQAFGFATNDEINNMTFYNYELINRSTFTLTETYFGIFADTDIGGYNDDYVGCDVMRGLGYCYNGDNQDDATNGALGYGENPPAIGIDFFEGPYQDEDNIDNAEGIGFNEALNGIGYGDGIVDNERYGMRRFVFFNRADLAASCCGDPSSGAQYYNYLRGVWLDGTKMIYGGNGHSTAGGIEADFMLPGDTDPSGWGTGGQTQEPWSEITAGNTPSDRRFVQSAGPFTLTPGAINDITVGVVWAQATSGGNEASVDLLIEADVKTQAMFDNCFRTLDGPEAPNLEIQELENKLTLFITNPNLSNNYKENYIETNAFIVPPDSIELTDETGAIIGYQRLSDQEKIDYQTYNFEGYKIYQIKNNTVDASSLDDPDKARLIYQGDLKNDITTIINYTYDQSLDIDVPQLMVDGNNEGIEHSILVTEDQFATGNKTLVNHKTYCFMAIAYAYNNFKPYSSIDPSSQKIPYLPSRKSATGVINYFCGIPHNTGIENNGTILNSEYGDGVQLTRIEGIGNGGNYLQMTQTSVDAIMAGEPWFNPNPTYEKGMGPVSVKIIDPLNVVADEFVIKFIDEGISVNQNNDTTLTWGDVSDASWMIYKKSASSSADTIKSDRTIEVGYDQIILDWGLSINILDNGNAGSGDASNGYIGANIVYDNPNNQWLSGVMDGEGQATNNWIRAGAVEEEDWVGIDDGQAYEGILSGTWAPFRLTSQANLGPMPLFIGEIVGNQVKPDASSILDSDLSNVQSVDIYFTSDKSKWTRCPVVEAHYDPANTVGSVRKGQLRDAPSVDKEGNPTTSTDASTNSADANYISATGMGWFPGYAINIETGERLNMAFSENSWLKNENGNDMLWNPTQNLVEGPFNEPRGGGMHFIYVFRNNVVDEGTDEFFNDPTNRMPAYDYGLFAHNQLDNFIKELDRDVNMVSVYKACMWTGYPLLAPNAELLSSDVKIELRVSTAYATMGTQTPISDGASLIEGTSYIVSAGPITYKGLTYERGDTIKANTDLSFATSIGDKLDVLIPTINEGLPMYQFTTEGLAPVINDAETANSVLDEIRVVPNPYYSYSSYETDKLDNRVKITNLPEKCIITIYTVNGVLIRQYKKDDPTITSIDWNLKNKANIPIAGGVYLIHVDAYELGEERILKWFGSLRPIDLDSF